MFQVEDYFRFKEYVIIKQATLKYKLSSYWPYLYFIRTWKLFQLLEMREDFSDHLKMLVFSLFISL